MKRLLGLTLAATAGLSITIAIAAEPERIRGTVSAISADEVTVSTPTGAISMQAGAGTKYLTVVHSDLNHIATEAISASRPRMWVTSWWRSTCLSSRRR
jgi:hypothetical protein